MVNERVGYIDFMKVMGMFCIVLGVSSYFRPYFK